MGITPASTNANYDCLKQSGGLSKQDKQHRELERNKNILQGKMVDPLDCNVNPLE